MQFDIVRSALRMFEAANAPRTVEVDAHRWGSDAWRDRYMHIKPEDRERMRRLGEERRRERQRLRDIGQVRNG